MNKKKMKLVSYTVPCDCNCHTEPGWMHCFPCCDRDGMTTLWKYEEVEEDDLPASE